MYSLDVAMIVKQSDTGVHLSWYTFTHIVINHTYVELHRLWCTYIYIFTMHIQDFHYAKVILVGLARKSISILAGYGVWETVPFLMHAS